MTYSRVAFRPGQGVRLLSQAQAGERLERSVRVRVGIAWGLLFFNTLTFYPHTSFIPIPATIGKAIAQAALPAALLVALSVNPKVIVRPNVLLCLVSLLVVGAVLPMLQPQSFGIVYRTFRMAGFVAGLWLLTPWWGRRDLLLVRWTGRRMTACAIRATSAEKWLSMTAARYSDVAQPRSSSPTISSTSKQAKDSS
jgi:hypothetical protein